MGSRFAGVSIHFQDLSVDSVAWSPLASMEYKVLRSCLLRLVLAAIPANEVPTPPSLRKLILSGVGTSGHQALQQVP